MRLILASAAGVLVMAAPALAGEARVEIQGGVGWNDGQDVKGVIGGAAGYDWSLPGGAFIGAEESVDKGLAAGYHVRWGTSGRLGAHVTPRDKLYVTAGYNYGRGPNATDVGGGWEHNLGSALYGKVEYKHFFTEDGAPDSNATLVGVGVHF